MFENGEVRADISLQKSNNKKKKQTKKTKTRKIEKDQFSNPQVEKVSNTNLFQIEY